MVQYSRTPKKIPDRHRLHSFDFLKKSFPSIYSFKTAAKALKSGKILIYPTEHVYSLGVLCDQKDSIARLSLLKTRPSHKHWIVLVSRWEDLQGYIDTKVYQDHKAHELALMSSVMRPLSCVFPAGPKAPSDLALNGEITIRICQLSILQELYPHIQTPLISTSANFSQKKPCRNRRALIHFLEEVAFLNSQKSLCSSQKIFDLVWWDLPLGPAKTTSTVVHFQRQSILRGAYASTNKPLFAFLGK